MSTIDQRKVIIDQWHIGNGWELRDDVDVN
jgi:hypothetical protein